MIMYAVNSRTKVHRRYAPTAPLSNEEMVIHGDADGWLTHYGAQCPLPDDHRCDVRFKSGLENFNSRASKWYWRHNGFSSDIAAYRPILDADTKPEPPAWDGEGLPPVGSAFEFSENGISWEERTMLFDDGITCLMANRKYPANRWHYKSDDPDLHFRPIRSEEDLALDKIMCDCGVARCVARTIYHAGYRKSGGE